MSGSERAQFQAKGDHISKKTKKGGWGVPLFVLVALLAVVFAAIDANRNHFFVFDPEVLHQVAVDAVHANLTTKETFARITRELHKIYPQYIDVQDEWMFNIAGGAMGHMTLLHCSITEYVIIFGSPIGTEGFSGRFLSDDYFTILEGEQWSYEAGELDARVFRAGDRNIMPRLHATGYRMPGKAYALEYARGNIPLMLPFGVWDTLFSTVDFPTLFSTFYHYGRITINQLMIGKI